MNLLAVLAVLLGALASSACTTLSPKEATPEDLQRQLLVGGVGYSVVTIILVALAPALLLSGG